MLTVNDLHGYQRKIANTILKKQSTFVIAEMGLGKTVSVLSAVEYLQRENRLGPALIIGPLRVIYNSWPVEIGKWAHTKNIKYHILHGKKKQDQTPKADIYGINFEGIPYIIESGIWKKCDILIIDESSKIKDPSTKRFKALKKIAGKFKKTILLTGTPSQSGKLTELFSQVYMLDCGKRLGTSAWAYKTRYYYKADFMGYDWQLKPGSDQEIRSKISDISIVLKAEDYLTLPPCISTTIIVNIPDAIKKLYRDMEKDFVIELNTGMITAANAAVKSGKLRQIAAGGIYNENQEYKLLHEEKIDALQEIIDSTSDNVLVCFQFRFEKAMLTRRFQGSNFIDGETSATESNKIISDWNDKKIKILCCHPQSVGHGLNLQHGGHTLVWLSPDWSLERTQQMEARIVRQGQTEKTYIYTIAVKDSIDLMVSEVLRDKCKGQDDFISKLKTKLSGGYDL